MAAREFESALIRPRLAGRHLVFWAFVAMRWLVMALLVSLGALLLAAAGMARHILLHRAKKSGTAPRLDGASIPEETDLESEG
jgi:hypothetical protein